MIETAVVTTSPFAISQRETPTGVLRVSLSGDFDMSVGDALVKALHDAAVQRGIVSVVLDLDAARFIDSHGVAGLVSGYEAAKSAGRTFTVVNSQGVVRQVLDVTGLSELLCS